MENINQDLNNLSKNVDRNIENKNFMSLMDLFEKTKLERRSRNINNIIRYWIGLLDDYLWWILENELVVVGAWTGIWKTEIANSIAIHNAKRGFKVNLLALEWDPWEIYYRYIQWEINKKLAWMKYIKPQEFRLNLVDIEAIEDEVVANTPQSLRDNLKIYWKKEIPNQSRLEDIFTESVEDCDLIVLDHLHYLDYNWESEARGITGIMKMVKMATEILRVPVVLISHLSRNLSWRPKISDLHWSSNIEKNANTVILLNPCDSSELVNNLEDWKYYRWTEIIVAKNRTGVPVPAVFETHFNLKTKEYMNWEDFNLLSPDETNRVSIDDKIDSIVF